MSPTDLGTLVGDSTGLARTTTLFRENGLRGLLLHLNAGEQIPEHQTRGAISVHCLKGKARFANAGESVLLNPGSLISLPGEAPHSVKAEEDTLLLVTVWEQTRTEDA